MSHKQIEMTIKHAEFLSLLTFNLVLVKVQSMRYVCSNSASKQLGVSASTLRRWLADGRIQAIKAPSGHNLYDISPFVHDEHSTATAPTAVVTTRRRRVTSEGEEPEDYIYARVSSAKQRGDLQRQVEFLLEHYPGYRILSDVGSGLNFKRPGLRTLLERSRAGLVKSVVVAQRDRLCRFAFDLLEYVLALNGTSLVVHQSDDTPSDRDELADDLMAINTVFICRMQGRRAAEYRRQRRRQP